MVCVFFVAPASTSCSSALCIEHKNPQDGKRKTVLSYINVETEDIP